MINITLFVKNKKTTLNVKYDVNKKRLNLSYENITDFCEETVFPEGIEKLDISGNQITNLDSQSGTFRFPDSLTELHISDNQITNLDGRTGTFRFPETLAELWISNNQIEKLDGRSGTFRFPESLIKLWIYGNQITNLDGRIGTFRFPESVTKLYIYDNQITNIDGRIGTFRFPESLTELYISFNQITNLDGQSGTFRFPESLTKLDISRNQIVNLDGRSGTFRFPEFLTKLWISNNQIVNLDGRDGTFRFPESLTKLDIFSNQIMNLDGCDGTFRFPETLAELWISGNQITNLPLSMINLRLTKFFYYNNPVENVHPVIQRFIERIERNGNYSNSESIYENRQNVHDIKVQNSTRDSLQKIMVYEQKIQASNLDDSLISHLNTKEIHSFFGVTEREVLSYVENAINLSNSETQEQLYFLLKEAIEEGKSVCSTGKIGRMVNVLSGFDPNVNIQISDRAQISAIILEFRKRNESRENVEKELLSRNILEEEIKEWMEYY